MIEVWIFADICGYSGGVWIWVGAELLCATPDLQMIKDDALESLVLVILFRNIYYLLFILKKIIQQNQKLC